MDPHLRAVKEWDKNYLPLEKEAYYEARINGYVFPQLGPDDKIGSLWADELEVIASHPPSINLKRYKYYRNMDIEQLKREFPGVVKIIGPNNVTYEDLFYYATRGWIPEYDSINLKIDRWNQYDDMSEVSKGLMDKIYGNRGGYVNSNPHDLEQSIIAFDQNMDSDSAIRSIADRIGINIPHDVPAHDFFYDAILDQIDRL